MRKRILPILLASGALILCSGCSSQESERMQTILVQEDERETLATVAVDYGAITQTLSIPCTYTATERINLSFPVSKLITKVYVNKGDFVSKGDLLAALDVEETEQESIEEQEYQIERLELQIAQTRELYEFDLSSAETLFQYTVKSDKDKENLADKKKNIDKQYKNTLEDLEDRLVIEKKRLEEARQEMSERLLYATMDGVITFRAGRQQNSYSKADETFITISSLDSYYFIVDNADYVEYFVEGENMDISYKAATGLQSCQAVVERRDEEEGRVYLKLLTDEMPEDGAEGKMEVQLAQKENVLCIPKSALHQSDQGPFVYLSKEGLLEMRFVTVGLEGESTVEITEGLAQGDMVALKG